VSQIKCQCTGVTVHAFVCDVRVRVSVGVLYYIILLHHQGTSSAILMRRSPRGLRRKRSN
jgi:hypothetical protein